MPAWQLSAYLGPTVLAATGESGYNPIAPPGAFVQFERDGRQTHV